MYLDKLLLRVSDCSGNPFFCLGKVLAKKDCNGKRGFVKKCLALVLDFLQNTPKINLK
jgi:hypothetical protein